MKPVDFILTGPIAVTRMICETIDKIFLLVTPKQELSPPQKKEYTLPVFEVIEGGRQEHKQAL